jgi:N-acetyltransferase 10
MTPFDLKRLESYANNMLDYHVILDLLPNLASLYFEKRLNGDVQLSAVQSSILLALGLQRKSVEEVEVREFKFCYNYRLLFVVNLDRTTTPSLPSAGALRQDSSKD